MSVEKPVSRDITLRHSNALYATLAPIAATAAASAAAVAAPYAATHLNASVYGRR